MKMRSNPAISLVLFVSFVGNSISFCTAAAEGESNVISVDHKNNTLCKRGRYVNKLFPTMSIEAPQDEVCFDDSSSISSMDSLQSSSEPADSLLHKRLLQEAFDEAVDEHCRTKLRKESSGAVHEPKQAGFPAVAVDAPRNPGRRQEIYEIDLNQPSTEQLADWNELAESANEEHSALFGISKLPSPNVPKAGADAIDLNQNLDTLSEESSGAVPTATAGFSADTVDFPRNSDREQEVYEIDLNQPSTEQLSNSDELAESANDENMSNRPSPDLISAFADKIDLQTEPLNWGDLLEATYDENSSPFNTNNLPWPDAFNEFEDLHTASLTEILSVTSGFFGV